VYRTNTYLESGRLKIFNSCAGLRAELLDYKFPSKKLGQITRGQDKPEDKNNHAINPMEWICMALPHNPKDLMYGVYNRQGIDISKEVRDLVITPWQFAEEQTTTTYEGGDWY
jgi:hypothetical protein